MPFECVNNRMGECEAECVCPDWGLRDMNLGLDASHITTGLSARMSM